MKSYFQEKYQEQKDLLKDFYEGQLFTLKAKASPSPTTKIATNVYSYKTSFGNRSTLKKQLFDGQILSTLKLGGFGFAADTTFPPC